MPSPTAPAPQRPAREAAAQAVGADRPHDAPPAAGHAPGDRAQLRDRYRLIADIRRFNPTAEEAFLCQFNAEQLGDYLDHLRLARHKHVRLAGWVQRRAARLDASREALAKSRQTLRQAS